jgi:acyl-CoA synthetase (AMP-forming)/AMP-acid ligase II
VATLFERLQQHGCGQADRAAVWQRQDDGTYGPTTYGRLAASARRLANAFLARVPADKVIPLCLAKSPDCIAAMFGAVGAGRAFACLNQKLRPPQIERILNETQAPLALIDGPGLMALKGGITADSPLARTRWWLLRGPGFGPTHERLADQLRAVAAVEDWVPEAWPDAAPPSPPPLSPGGERGERKPLSPPGERGGGEGDSDPRRVGCCLFTSGSTGSPKGVLIGVDDLRARADAEVLWYGLTAADVLLSILPFSFDVGLNQLLSAVSVGCELVILDSWFPRDILKAVEVRQVTGISSVPSIWLDFLNLRLKFDKTGAHASLRYLTVSGGDMSRRHLDELPGIAEGVGIFKTYGQTEAFRATSLKPHEYAAKRYSVGRPFHGVRVYIVGPDGACMQPNEPGEVVHTGLGVMLGYLDGKDPEHKLRPNPFAGPDDPAPWAVFTGDQGRLDEDGYLYLEGRRDDMVKIQGNRIYPNEVRDQLLAVPGVGLAEVVAVKSVEQTRLVAFVVPAAGAALNGPAVQRQLAGRAPSYMVPELVVLKEAFPRTASGKPDRPALAAEAAALLNAQAPNALHDRMQRDV